ncbi:MAG: hypothetical protein ACRED5_03810 [Propylenella sp.]
MDEPWTRAQHPPGPAFAKARREDEHRRQQRIAKLTPDQRREFDQLQRDQQRQLKDLEKQQKQQWRGRMAEQMRKDLLQDKAPHLRPPSHSHQLKDSPDLSHAINDFLDGRQSRAANAYKSELHRAYGKARTTVARTQARERDRQDRNHGSERDAFLDRAERQRGEKAREPSQQRPTPAFERTARDPSWQRAFNRAAKREAQREKQIDHEKTRDPRDDPGRAR